MNTYLHRRSLSTKLRVVVLASTLVALVVALGAIIAYDLGTTRRGWIADVDTQAQMLGHATAADVAAGDARGVHDTLAMLRFEPRVHGAAIYDAGGRLLASYAIDAAAPPPPATLPRAADGEVTQAPTGAERDLAVRRAIVGDDGRTVGTVYLRARDELHDRVVSFSVLALLIAMAALAATWLVSSWLQAIVTRPIRAVADVARDVVQQHDYSRRALKLNEDEVGELVDAFNGMLAEIERGRAEQELAAREKDREVAERRLAQSEVMRLNEELERRVQERTAQLESLNRDLTAATSDAQAANRAKSEFLSNMSHELRTPLNAIIGFGQLLAQDDLRTESAERNLTFVAHIVDAGNHLLKLINEILNLAQIEAGKLSISLEPVELRDVLEECHALTRTASAQRGIRLLFPQETTLRVHADRTRLKQVLLNLLSNAVKYNRDHGAVIVDCAQGDEGRVRLSVQDTGNGMTAAELRTLFQPFNRLGRDGTGIEGSGIGLMLTRKLVELMGGMIGLHSTPGSGSTFWIDLRSAAPTRIEREATTPRLPAPLGASTEALGTSTILCVDDNRANLALLTEALSLRADCVVLTATDGQAGVDMARSHRPDVILMDNNMPVLSGRDAMRILRADPLTAGIPVIAVSAAAMPNMVSSGLELGYFRYLVKPYDLVDLTDAVDAAIDAAKGAAHH
jgi:signal transduction histidine kinase